MGMGMCVPAARLACLPSPSPPRPPARSATGANASGRSGSEPRLKSGTPQTELRLMTPQPGFAARRCPGPVLTEVTALGVCIIPRTVPGADGSDPEPRGNGKSSWRRTDGGSHGWAPSELLPPVRGRTKPGEVNEGRAGSRPQPGGGGGLQAVGPLGPSAPLPHTAGRRDVSPVWGRRVVASGWGTRGDTAAFRAAELTAQLLRGVATSP